MVVLEVLDLLLASPASLCALEQLLARRAIARGPEPTAQGGPSARRRSHAPPRTIELAVTLRVRLRRT